MKLLLAGDTHGDLEHVQYLNRMAVKTGCERVVQVGDFGYWPHREPFHERVSAAAGQAGLTWFWLDGNHENFDALEKAVDTEAASPQPMEEHLWYLPRASTWTWDGCRFLALGGAPSIDKVFRRKGTSWWEQELLTDAQVARAQAAGPADVMLTHDAPEEVWPTEIEPHKVDPLSKQHRMTVSTVVAAIQPRLLVHGHYHHRYSAKLGEMAIEGLGRNGQQERSWMVLDTADWT